MAKLFLMLVFLMQVIFITKTFSMEEKEDQEKLIKKHIEKINNQFDKDANAMKKPLSQLRIYKKDLESKLSEEKKEDMKKFLIETSKKIEEDKGVLATLFHTFVFSNNLSIVQEIFKNSEHPHAKNLEAILKTMEQCGYPTDKKALISLDLEKFNAYADDYREFRKLHMRLHRNIFGFNQETYMPFQTMCLHYPCSIIYTVRRIDNEPTIQNFEELSKNFP